jgi:hypothetical protein
MPPMPGRILLLAAVVVAVAAAPTRAHAQDYFGGDTPPEEITFRTDKPRSRGQRILLASLFGGAALAGGIGLVFHLDSRSKSNQVSAVGDHTGRVYDEEVDATRRGALRSRTAAIVGYGVGGAALIAGVIAWFVTEPGTEVVTAGKDKDTKPPPPTAPPVSLAPLPGGVLASAGWTF